MGATEREIAKIIYETCYVAADDPRDDDPMPSFDEAEADPNGGYRRALAAAELVVSRIPRLTR